MNEEFSVFVDVNQRFIETKDVLREMIHESPDSQPVVWIKNKQFGRV